MQILYLLNSESWNHECDQFLEHYPNGKIVILEEQKKLSFSSFDLPHPRAELIPFSTSDELSFIAANNPTKELFFIGFENHSYLQEILEQHSLSWNLLVEQSLHAPLFYQNAIQNIPTIANSFDISSWKGLYQETPALLCGAGPSLSKIKDSLSLAKNKMVVMGGGSALSALSQIGIAPDLAIAIDPNPESFAAISSVKTKSTPLLYGSRIAPKTLSFFEGPKGYIRTNSGGPFEAWLEKVLQIEGERLPIPKSPISLSVASLMTALAIFLGCNPIFFAGIDLSFIDGNLYAEGVKTRTHPYHQIRSSSNLTTTPLWQAEAKFLGELAENNPNTRIFNLSQGIPLGSIPFLLSDDFQKMITPLPSKKISFSFETRAAKNPKIEKPLQELKKSLEKSRDLLQIILGPSEGKKNVAIYDLEEELAFKPLLEEMLLAYKLRGKNCSEETEWSFLLKAIDHYLSFM